MVNSINKGKGFERVTAKLLTKLTGVDWQRVPQSGAFATVNRSEDPRFFGDVFTEDSEFSDVVIECKNYSALEINDLFNEGSKFWKWVEQASTESKGLDWLLIIQIKRRGIFCVPSNLAVLKRFSLDKHPLIVLKHFTMLVKIR